MCEQTKRWRCQFIQHGLIQHMYMWCQKKRIPKTKKKQTHRYREQTSNQWGERRGRGNIRVGGKERVTHSSTLAWKIPWMEEPGRLQSMGLLGVWHDWATSLSLFTFMHWRRKWQPLQCSCLENPREGGAWWAAIYGVAQSRTRLKWLSLADRKSVV